MENKAMNDLPPKLDTTTRLALERTRLSYDRTLMSAVRTATSLITFGFTVYKFFQFELKGRDVSNYLIGPREFGIAMIIIGLFSLAVTSFECRRDLKEMSKIYPGMPHSSAGIIAGLIAALGTTALIVMIIRK